MPSARKGHGREHYGNASRSPRLLNLIPKGYHHRHHLMPSLMDLTFVRRFHVHVRVTMPTSSEGRQLIKQALSGFGHDITESSIQRLKPNQPWLYARYDY